MRLDRFQVGAFGGLENFEASDLSASKLVVVVGGNEGGKSTFLEYLTTMMFGFTPANREQNPYSPWSGQPMAGAASLQLRDGTAMSIGRRLRHLPEAKLEVGETEKLIGNAPLPSLGPITREIWRSFHALTPDELNEMDENAWTAVEERLLGGCHLEFLRAVREAASDLDGRAGALWQAHSRGHTVHRRVALVLRRLRRERDQAVARACRLAELRELIAGRNWHIQTAEEQLVDLRARLDRAETLLPVLRAIQQMDELRRKAQDRLPQDDWPEDAQGQLSLLRAAVAEHDRTAAEVGSRSLEFEQRSKIPAEDEALLAVESDVRALVSEASVHHQDVVHLNDIGRECDAQEALFKERAASLFAAQLDAKGREALARVGMADLQARIKEWEDCRRLPDEAQADVVRAQEAVKIAQADFEVLPSVDAEKKLRQREEALRQLQSREDLLVAIQNDIKAAKAQATMVAGNIKTPGVKLGTATLQGAGLVGAGLSVAATLIMGGSSWYWLLGPVALGLVGAGARTLKNRKNSSGPRMPDEVRADALARECLKLRAELELHEYETFVGHLERAQQALALVAQRPELERRLIAARQRLEECKRRVNDRKEEVRRGSTRLAESLDGLPLLPARANNPGHDLITDLSDLRGMQRQLTRLQGEREAVAARAQEREKRAGQLAEKLGLSSSGSPMDSIPLWHDRLQRAISMRRRAEEALHLLPSATEAATQAAAGQKEARGSLEALQSRLCKLDTEGGTVEGGLRCLSQARAWRAEADALEQQLHARFPDWRERSDEARTASGSGQLLDMSTEQRVEMTRRVNDLDNALVQLRNERQTLRGERDRLAGQRSLGDIDGAIAALQEESERITRRRDRLALLSSILREADRRWRDRFQPPVLRAASSYLQAVTKGRWDNIHAEPHDGGARLYVNNTRTGRAMLVSSPLSRSLRGQIHLSLRLAVAEAFDGDEPMPLVLDDVLVDWDDERVSAALGLLEVLARSRQIFLLTSRPTLAERLREKAGARVLALPAPRDGQPRDGQPRDPQHEVQSQHGQPQHGQPQHAPAQHVPAHEGQPHDAPPPVVRPAAWWQADPSPRAHG